VSAPGGGAVAGGPGGPRRILIVNITRLGDQLQTSPTIAGLKERHPGAEITMLGDRHYTEVCHGIPGVDRVYEIDLDRLGQDLVDGGVKLVDAYRYLEGVVRELRNPGFDLALNYSSSRMSGVFMRLLRVRDCRGWSMDSEGHRLITHPWSRLFCASVLNRRYTPYNLVDFYCRVAGVRPRERRLWYTVTPAARARAAALRAEHGVRPDARVVALQAGASHAIRQWPAAAFAALGRLLRERLGARTVLVGGPGDAALAQQIAAEIGDDAIVACGRTTVAELAALLGRTALLVSGDTGPMHLAAAVGTPVVALFFGPAYVWETGPYGADNVVLQTRIACAPCSHTVACLAPVCREELTPEMVFWAVHDRLAQDYAALARRAAGWPVVDIYRIGFDAEGMYDPTPLVPRADRVEALRLAFRELWRLALDGRGDEGAAAARLRARWAARGGRGAALDWTHERAALARLLALARRGQALAASLVVEASRPEPALARLEALAADTEGLDAEILRLGHVHEAVATLARMFGFGKENLSDTLAVDVLARETVALYGDLARWAGLGQRLVDVVDGARRGAAAGAPAAMDDGVDGAGPGEATEAVSPA
jgi:ADP-heptose:LPS heptosyltransferase